MRNIRTLYIAGAAVCLWLLAGAAVASVNQSIRIGDGETSGGDSSVNGSITVGSGATVTGELSTVNGKITVGDDSSIEDAHTVNGSISLGNRVTAEDIETVNGSIRMDGAARIDGGIQAVNGAIRIEPGSRVARDVENVNGDMEINGSEIGGSLTTVSGDVELAGASVLKGDLVVQKPRSSGWFNKDREPTVIIGPESRVEGVIRLERKVKLYIADGASVGGVEGVMTLDEAERFSGERP